MRCGAWAVVGTADDGTVVVHPLYCKSWNCRRCAHVNKRRLLRRLEGVESTTFMTLTCNNKLWGNPGAAWVSMSIAVNHLLKRMRRQWPSAELEYFLVWEKTKQGWPHAHLLLRAPFIPQDWLSRHWEELTGAPIVDIRQVHTPVQAMNYIAKYLAKEPAAPPHCKRFRSSKKFFGTVVPMDNPRGRQMSSWRLEAEDPATIARALSLRGYSIALEDNETFVAYPPGHPSAPKRDLMTPRLGAALGV